MDRLALVGRGDLVHQVLVLAELILNQHGNVDQGIRRDLGRNTLDFERTSDVQIVLVHNGRNIYQFLVELLNKVPALWK